MSAGVHKDAEHGVKQSFGVSDGNLAADDTLLSVNFLERARVTEERLDRCHVRVLRPRERIDFFYRHVPPVHLV
jgi:hypothetical protein